MKLFYFCKTCGAYCYANDLHVCAPAWKVWYSDDNEEDWNNVVYSYSPRIAATKFAEQCDREYDNIIEDSCEITVRNIETNEIFTYYVSGELVPKYTATEI